MLLNKQTLQISLLASAIALTGCGSSSSNSADEKTPEVVPEVPTVTPEVPPVTPEEPVVPEIPSETARTGITFSGKSISAKGGESVLGEGGNGGEIEVFKTNSTTALNIVKTEKIDPSYTVPAQTPAFGINPVTITETQTITLLEENATAPALGTLYMVAGKSRLFKSTGEDLVGDEHHIATGLVVNEGVTLSIPANSGSSNANLYFNNDIKNNGVMTTINNAISSRIDLQLTTAAYYGTGDINLKGDVTKYYRQSGGDFRLGAYTIMNAGLINTSGANKSSENDTGNGGGNAGTIQLYAGIFIENKGELRANGGASDSDAGTNGADISLEAVAIVNTGLINSNSGSGNSQNYSSNNSDISLNAYRSILNTGDISSKGADVGEIGNAGKGGDIRLYVEHNYEIAYNQSIINTGNLNVDGGSITGESNGNAGNGGNISIETGEPEERSVVGPIAFEISGNLSANGGSTIDDGSTAGNGGNIYIANYDNPSSSAETFLVGYQEINTSGGNGVYAGDAGSIDIEFDDFRDVRGGGSYVPTVSGSIFNDVDLIANGGTTTANAQNNLGLIYGSGADGGQVALSASNYSAYLQPGAINVTNKGAISVNGGDSFNDSSRSNANGGYVNVSAAHKIEITQPISLNGGNDLHTASAGESDDHAGSNAGNLMVLSQYEKAVINTDISANGGNGDLIGGHGGMINVLTKDAISFTGTVSLNGGDTITDDADSLETQGGDAGLVYAVAETMNSKVITTITANAGAGDQTGEEKVIYVDADCLSNNCNLDRNLFRP